MTIKRFLLALSVVLMWVSTNAQTSTEFWFAPPYVSPGHVASNPAFLRMASGDNAATITVDQPANPGFNGGTPITVNLAANSSTSIDLSAFMADLETTPSDQVLTTGLRVVSTENITCYYEVNTINNPDIYALKGKNGLGTEFYTPIQNSWRNGDYTPTPYTSFDIVATENNTTVIIYPRVDLDGGHNALESYTVTLNQGETYSGSVTSIYGSDNPTGTAIVADKDIAVSTKDDSAWPEPAGCRDLIGDQLVPVDIVGYEYIVNKGGLTVPEYVYLTSTQNSNAIYVDGTQVATLFAGETYRVEITNPLTYINCSQPTYAFHVSGFGCEVGGALLPPLNCAGSEQVNFVRSTNEYFGLNIVVPAGSEGDFEINGDGTILTAGDFTVVPGTAGAWMGAQISFTTGEIPVGSNNIITNSSEVFSVGLINGGASSGCRFGYFSEFSGEIVVDPGTDLTVCTNSTAMLNGSVTGGATTGEWSTSGSGTFVPSVTDLNAEYIPSEADISSGFITLTLTSTGNCFPVSETMTISFLDAPEPDAGADTDVCSNNADVDLSGTVANAGGGLWSGGNGTFANNTSLITTYTPTPQEITDGSVTLTLTTTGNGICDAESDDIIITFTPAPTAAAGPNQTACANNAEVDLSGSVTIATGGQWTGGNGSYDPGSTALSPSYAPTAAEIASGSVTLTLTTTGNANCNAESDAMTITFTDAPTVNAGGDQTKCENNAATQLIGAVGGATGGQWSGGLGTFSPSNTALNAIYTPTAGEIASGSLILTLTSTGNGDCSPETDQMTISFTGAPTANAGTDQTVCGNNADVSLSGSVTVATGGIWSGGTGSYNPSSNALNTIYSPSAAEIAAGEVTLTLTTSGNGNCTSVSDDVTITITPAPVVNAGPNQTACANNAAITLGGSVSNAGGGVWSGGNGSFSPSSNSLTATYTPTAAEISSGNVTLTLTSTNNGDCNSESDQMTITYTPAPIVNAGTDQTKCANNANIQLTGSMTGATGVQWSGGSGSYAPNSTDIDPIYTPSAAEIAAGSVTLTLTTTGNDNCNAESDQVTINFTPAPTVDAGIDRTVCGNNAEVTLNGAVTIATGGIWSGGAGSFNPSASDLNAVYTPSPGEISAGSVTLTLTSAGNGNCTSVTDEMTISITPAPVVNAGSNLTACANNAQITLSGSVSNAGGGSWSGGSGTFSPSSNSLTATYTPTAAEIASGNVTLTLTSTNNGDCNQESDQMTISYTPAPTVSAGIDQTKCANNANVQLTGSMTGADGVQWSGGSGSYAPNNTDIDPIYTPSAAEIAAGSVTLTLTTTGNDNCNAESDQVTINFTPAPTVDAGIDRTVCGNNAEVTLNGTVTVASGGIWSGGAGSFNPSASDVNAVYTPAPEEITNGSVTLTLTSAGNGNCTPVTDDMTINFTPAPVVNAGSDLAACANNAQVVLSGSVSNAGGGSWSGGNGTFSPSNSTLNATYTPTIQEIASGSVTLTLTSTNNGNCLAESDNVTIIYGPAPEVSAGSDQTKCANNPTIQLNGNMFGADGVQWTGGLGTFSPSSTALSAVYTPTEGEIASGNIFLTLTSTGNGNCNAVTDQLEVTFTAAPTADANLDQTVCASTPEVQLDGSVTIGSGGQWSGGNGVFSPNANALDATYTPTSTEILSGEVILTLTTTGNGNCLPGTDEIIITIEPQATANAGPNQTSCANNPTVDLAGIVANAGGGIWSGGNGVFNPSNTDLNATYTPTSTEIANGSVTLTLTTTDNGSCNAGSDSMTLSISPEPVASAGNDQTVCVNNSDIQLNGSVNLAAGGTWSGGLGNFTPNNNALNAVYTPTQTELNSGSITLTLTTTGNGSCIAVEDEVTVNFTAAPSADAGTDITVCANDSEVQLDGSINLASGGVWSGGNGTFSPDASTMDAVYTPTTAEIAAGTLTLTLSTTGNGNCSVETDEVEITITPAPAVSAGENQIVCVDDANVSLSGSIAGPTNSGQWTTLGSGSFVPSAQTLNASYQFSQADYDAGMVTLVLTSTNNGSCIAVTDTLEIEILPGGVAEAGDDETVCANNSDIQLNGVISGGATTGVWTTSGSGTFVPNAQTLNATYLPSTGDNNNGFVTLTLTSNSCNDASDQVEITITPAPEVDAGDDVTICESETEIVLEGEISGATTTGIWTTTGTGTFDPDPNTLTATYVPSTEDYNNEGVSLVLTATGIGSCSPVNDTLQVEILPAATVNAGNNQTLCANNASVQLNGSVSGGNATAVWSTSGTGTFEPSADVLNASYIPSPADTLNGTVDLILSAVNSCNDDIDFVTIEFTDAPLVDAGDDQAICGTNPVADLSGMVSGATGGVWSTSGGGTFTPNAQSLNATYEATTADVDAGEILLYLTSTGNGQCVAEVDSLLLQFTDGIAVNAGNDQSICSTSEYTQLNGSVTNGSSTGIWTTSGTGTFDPGNETLNATYHPSQADVDAGEITLTLTSTNNGSCAGEVDQMTITFGPSAFTDAGADVSVCASAPEVDVQGFVSGGSTTGEWTTSGSGAFTPDATSLDATYTPSETDILNGTVNLILSSTDNGSCQPGTDTLTVTINPIPSVSAGSDITICEQTESVFLNGSVDNAEGATWTSTGTGTFEPSADDLSAEYVPSLSDMNVGEITLTLTSFGSEICSPVSDEVVITVSDPFNPQFSFEGACAGEPLQFTDESEVFFGSISEWSWEFGDGLNSTAQNPVHGFEEPGVYDVTLTITSSLGCEESTTQSIVIIDNPTAEFLMSDTTIAAEETIVFTDLSEGAESWSWSFGDGNSSDAQNPENTYVAPGTYNISLTVENAQGCSNTFIQTITVTDEEEEDEEVLAPILPTGFSPNGDGENDLLIVRGGPFKELKLKVYNNWGNLVFETQQPDHGWDGTTDGELQPVGDYVYTIYAVTEDDREFNRSGNVTIIK